MVKRTGARSKKAVLDQTMVTQEEEHALLEGDAAEEGGAMEIGGAGTELIGGAQDQSSEIASTESAPSGK